MRETLSDFKKEYEKLLEADYDMYKSAVKEIIKVGFIVRGIDNRNTKYYEFISKYQNLFQLTFELIGFEFHDRKDLLIYYIKDEDNSYVRNLRKEDTIILLVLRSLYEEAKEQTTMHDDVYIRYQTLNQRLVDVGYKHVSKDRAQIQHVRESLRLFRDQNIIRFPNRLNDEDVISIYPSIECVFDFMEMDILQNRKKELIKGVEEDETNED